MLKLKLSQLTSSETYDLYIRLRATRAGFKYAAERAIRINDYLYHGSCEFDLGYSGFKRAINRHWGSIISSALFVSLLGAGVEFAAPTNNGDRDKDDPRSILAENAASAVAEAIAQIIQREANRQSIIKIKPGYRFMIFVQHDIISPVSGVTSERS